MKNSLLITSLFFISLFGKAQTKTDTLTNEGVLKLLKVGLQSDVIITKIRTSAVKFDVSTDALIKLNSAGVPGDIIQAMINPAGNVADNSNDSISIYKKWKEISRNKNGIPEKMDGEIKLQYYNDGTYNSIYINLKTGKKTEHGGHFELSDDKKNITYYPEKANPSTAEIIKLTDKDAGEKIWEYSFELNFYLKGGEDDLVKFYRCKAETLTIIAKQIGL